MARRSRGTKEWNGVTFNPTVLTTTQGILASFNHDLTETALRQRGRFLFRAVPDAAADDDIAAIGIIVVSDNAVGQGGASVPGPINDPDAPWLWHNYVPLAGGASTAEDPESIGLNVYVDLDSRAMRKVDRNEAIVLVAELQTGQFASVSVSGGWRTLSLLG